MSLLAYRLDLLASINLLAQTDVTSWVDLLDKGGTVAILVLIIFGGARGWYVPGWLYKQLNKELEEMKGLARSGTDLAERSANLGTLLADREREIADAIDRRAKEILVQALEESVGVMTPRPKPRKRGG